MPEPLTADEMVALAYRFYPRIDAADYRTYTEFLRDYYASSEVRARSIVQDQAWDRIEEFRALVDAVRDALPPGSYATDHTVPGHDAAYEAVFGPPGQPPGSDAYDNLVLQVSYLIPYYVLYESHTRYKPLPDSSDGKMKEKWRTLDVTDPSLVPMREVIERELSKRYGYRRFDSEIAMIRVPGIDMDGWDYDKGAPTLWAAMFAPPRW